MPSCEVIKKLEDFEEKYVAYIQKDDEASPMVAAKVLLGEAFVTISEARIIDTILSGDSTKEKKKVDSTLTAVLKYSKEFKVK